VPTAPKPSIETLLHAALPCAYVEHAHADAVLAVANVARSAEACTAAFGDHAPMVPYRHSGAALARACRSVFERKATANTIGLILAFHGMVAFGDTARDSYDNLQRLVAMAERYLQGHAAAGYSAAALAPKNPDLAAAEQLRSAVSAVAGYPLAMKIVCTPETMAFAQRPDLATVSQQGPPTPQHAIFTKRVPLIDGNVVAYATRYHDYLERTLGAAARGRIDAAPRIALDPRFGLCGLGVNEHYAAIAAEIYLHDIDIITRASTHGDYRAAGEHDIARAELEYGGFELRVRAQMNH
jgi:rhamnose utilization protein RhaD (predicted bifunctional aldolase and dehydrogenase)